MLSFLLILFYSALITRGSILKCDFETVCDDFITDDNWGLTDGNHPRPMDHDHTLNTSAGHYIFYVPQNGSRFQMAEIKTSNWLKPSTDRAICFQMWYFTPRLNLPFNVQLIQGDDEQLTSIVREIKGKDPKINDWTFVNVTLPSEKFKIFIRLNVTAGPLVFDDISVDYCDAPRPVPPKIFYSCDFESSCSNDFISLPKYPYQWSILKASDAIKIESAAPPIDYTFGNESGHYALLPNSKIFDKGNVGYLLLEKELHFTSQDNYCLNFQYYGYGRSYTGNLRVYAWTSDEFEEIQMIWPTRSSSQYVYTSNQWTWGIINLPIGHYSLLFRVDSTDTIPRTFALDNILIESCDYPSSKLSPYYSFLSFSCDFDNLTMCDMETGDRFQTYTHNFTVLTGDTVPNRKLGPTRDHTNNSTSGGFLYWNRQIPFTSQDSGIVHTSNAIEQNYGMCIRFAYYVKSSVTNKNGTRLGLSTGGCYGATLWYQSLDDSQGWQTVVIPLFKFACGETFYFSVGQGVPVSVSVAFDDIDIDQCDSFTTTTSTTSTTSTTTTSASTSTTTTITTSTSASSTTITTTVTSTTSAMSTITYTTTHRSNSQRLTFLNRPHLIVIYILYGIVRSLF